MSIVMFSTWVPGSPAINTPPEVIIEVLQESINIFWINDALSTLNLSFIPKIASPPVSEGVFNFVLAWAAMFLPAMLTDAPSQKVKRKVGYLQVIICCRLAMPPSLVMTVVYCGGVAPKCCNHQTTVMHTTDKINASNWVACG